jgi:hypothetical protein
MLLDNKFVHSLSSIMSKFSTLVNAFIGKSYSFI